MKNVRGIRCKKVSAGWGRLLLGGMLLVCSLCVSFPGSILAQTGKEFWFDVPEVNRGHVANTYDFHVYLHVTTLDFPAEVKIALPAEPGFTPLQFTMPASSTKKIELTDPNSPTSNSNFTNVNSRLSLFYNAYKNVITGENLGRTNKPQYIENVLGWSVSDPNAARPYLNRTTKGVQMTATATIMAYIEISVGWNMDLIALKGSNALGKKFIVPFQTELWTCDGRYFGMREPPYNSFNIVATQDNTKIRIKVPHEIWLNGNTGEQTGVNIGRKLPAGEHILWLNRGESSIIAPYAKQNDSPAFLIGSDQDGRGNSLGYQTSRDPHKRLAGSIVEVMTDEGSGGDIVVLTRDDITEGPNPDYVTDQLVPAVTVGSNGERGTLAGTDFGIVQGVVARAKKEYLYVLGTEDGTKVAVSGHGTYTLNEGQQQSIHMSGPSDRGVTVRATKPVLVFHMSGVEWTTDGQAQRGGAVIPALPQVGTCVGSGEVAFSRAKSGDYVFYLNVLAWDDPTNPARSAIGSFELYKESPTGFVRVTGSEQNLENYLNNRANWSRFPNVANPDPSGPAQSRAEKWSYVRVNTDDIGAGIVDGKAYLLVNKKNVFHLGVLNGAANKDAFYGYFSDFKSIAVSLDNVEVDTHGQVEGTKLKDICFGDVAILDVPLSKQFTYKWSAPDDPSAMDYLYNSTNYTTHQPYAQRMYVKGINRPVKYRVTVSGMCDLEKSRDIDLNVSVLRDPVFMVDPVVCVNAAGDPPVRVGLKRLNGANKIIWGYQRPTDPGIVHWRTDDGVLTDAVMHDLDLPYGGTNVGAAGELLPENTTVTAEVHKGGCVKKFTRGVQVMKQPQVPMIDLGGALASDCSAPNAVGGFDRTLTIKDANAANAMPGQVYVLEYGDGNSEQLTLAQAAAGVSYTFPARAAGYTLRLRTEDAEGSCRSDAVDVVVESKLVPKVTLTASPTQFCSESRAVRVESGTQDAKTYQWSYKTQRPGTVPTLVQPETLLGTGAKLDLNGAIFNGGYLTAQGSPLQYVFKLEAENGGCRASDEVSVTVLPNAGFQGQITPKRTDPTAQCGPYEYEYTAKVASNVARYEWRWRRVGDASWQPFSTGAAVADGSDLVATRTFDNQTSDDQEYEVQLEVWAAEGGCGQVLLFDKVLVPPAFAASIEGPRVEVCPEPTGEKEVVLRNLTTGGGTGIIYQWTIDGATSSQANPSQEFRHTFINTDTRNSKDFTVVLSARQGVCVQKATTVVRIYPRVSPRFTLQEWDATAGAPGALMVNAGTYCSPLRMVGTAEGAADYVWETTFDGRRVASSVGANYDLTYSNTERTGRRLAVTLLGTNQFGCSGEYRQEYTLLPAINATVLAEVLQACTPDTRVKVRVPGLASNAVSAVYELQGQEWETLQGNPRTQPDGAEIRYRTPGTYRLTLKVTDGKCSAVGTSNPFVILPGVQPELESLPAAQASGCSPLNVRLTPVAQSLQGATWARWEFGDGVYDAKLGAVDHTFHASGNAPVEYTVRLTAGNKTQCDARSKPAEVKVKVYPSPTAGGIVTAAADPCRPQTWKVENLQFVGTVDEVVWTFTPRGTGGAVVTSQGAPAVFPRDVELTNSLPNDPLRYDFQQVTYRQWAGGPRCASQPFEGSLTVAPTLKQKIDLEAAVGDRCGSVEVKFKDNSSGGKVRHTWTIDGGRTYTSERGDPMQITLTNTTQVVKESVVSVVSRQTLPDGRECVRQFNPDFKVKVYPSLQATIAWEVDDWCEVPLRVRVRATGVQSDAQCVWTTTAPQTANSTGTNPVELQFTNGEPENDKEFTIRLAVEQRWSGGVTCRGEAEPIKIAVPAPPKAVAKVVAQTNAAQCGTLEVSLDARESTGLSGAGSSYTWSFGDGAQADGKQVTHTYQNLGFDGTDDVYTAELRVRNARGCTDRAQLTFTVHPEVKALFSIKTQKICTPFEAEIENLSINGKRYKWQLRNPDETLNPSDPMQFTYTFDNDSQTTMLSRVLQLTAIAEHADGITCQAVSAPYTVTVPPRLVPSFRVSTPLAGCSPLEVQVENTTPSNMVVNGRYTWNWGSLHTATGVGPHSYTVVNGDRAASLKVPVWLEVSDGYGCRAQTAVQEVEVYPAVEAGFSASPRGGCSPLLVEVVNTRPSPAYEYYWTLGSQGVTTVASPGRLTYENPHLDRATAQREVISLETRLVGHPECKDRKEITVEVWPRVIADFTLSATKGCDPLEVKVKDKTQSAPGVRRYVWDASDGQRSLEAEPTFTFRNESRSTTREIDLTVTVSSEQGCTDTWRSHVTVLPTPVSGFSIVGDSRGCSPFALALEDKAEGRDLQYRYDFGDGKVETGNLTGQRMEHTYSNRGASPESHLLVQRVTTPEGCWAETSQQVHVNPQVTADFGVLPGVSGCSPFNVTLENHSINAKSYEWTFGDGGISTQENPGHQYVNVSPLDVKNTLRLVARSDYGCSDALEQEIVVHASPSARFEATPPAQLYPSTRVTVDNQSQPLVNSWDYTWEWGDGQSSQGIAPEPHVYEVWGDPANDFIIPITLTVTNSHCRSVARKEVIIRAPKPTVEFTANRVSGCPPLEVQMLNSTKYAESWVWYFNDGTEPSEEPEPRHVFEEPGSYHVRLVAVGPGGMEEKFLVFEVFQRPQVEFKVEPEKVYLPNAEVQALNLSVDAHSFRWDFGDGSTSLDESPYHTYLAPGHYDVKLTGLSQQGCEGSKTIKNAVFVDGSGRIRFPTAFRPQGPGGRYGMRDHSNSVFHPFVDGSVQDYKLMIFTRWGEKIFQTTDVNEGWDGYFNGSQCPLGVYAWRAVGTFYDGSVFDLKGNVTLLR